MTSLPTPPVAAATDEPEGRGQLLRRLGRLRHELNALENRVSTSDITRVLELIRGIDLRHEQLTDELAQIAASFGALEFAESIGRSGLPVIAALEVLPAGECCHYVGVVRFGRRRGDQFGHLELTSTRVRFRGALDIGVVWSEVEMVRRSGLEVVVSLRESRRLLRFVCATLDEAIRAAVIAEHLAGGARLAGEGSPESPAAV